MKIKVLFFNPIRERCHILYDETGKCAIVDPGMMNDNECGRLEKFIAENSLEPVLVLLTHGHFDHVAGCGFVLSKWNIPVYMNDLDRPVVESAEKACASMGIAGVVIKIPDTINIGGGDIVSFGNSSLSVMDSPGHTPGGVCFYSVKEKILFSGDSLFAGSIGRTDFPGGNYDDLMRSLGTVLASVDRDSAVYPGHGPETTVSEELNTNPFLNYM
ncbi:MAG: MBL fold metallo-hydrolase [Bacteroidales bacterium]|jgi:glyoxylase-like metal-dependent hydrolase (beta-lactamase superfamily II)|nr:MBL fold metallo-hydrolase [Bacteroidales bacterium]